MFEKGTIVKIADYGRVKESIYSSRIKGKGISTMQYMAPEAKLCYPWPYLSDLYSLGLIL